MRIILLSFLSIIAYLYLPKWLRRFINLFFMNSFIIFCSLWLTISLAENIANLQPLNNSMIVIHQLFTFITSDIFIIISVVVSILLTIFLYKLQTEELYKNMSEEEKEKKEKLTFLEELKENK
ncbi:hypothetical protein [Fusobacterium sp. SYSU M8A802]